MQGSWAAVISLTPLVHRCSWYTNAKPVRLSLYCYVSEAEQFNRMHEHCFVQNLLTHLIMSSLISTDLDKRMMDTNGFRKSFWKV